MLRAKKAMVILFIFAVVGMMEAETYGEAVERTLAEMVRVRNNLDGLSLTVVWFGFISFVVAAIYFAWLLSHGTDISRNRSLLKNLEDAAIKNAELSAKVEALSLHNQDLINRHEELIKLLLSKMGAQSPTQNVVVQQPPKQLPKPVNKVIEFDPNSKADQTWLAQQQNKRKQ